MLLDRTVLLYALHCISSQDWPGEGEFRIPLAALPPSCRRRCTTPSK